jgi:hypothetical protein
MARVAVVMPVGPSIEESFLRDTIESIQEFVPDRRLIVLDDSRTSTLAQSLPDDATVIVAGKEYQGWQGELYRSLSLGFREALSEPFDVLLRMDTDAVLLGGTFADRAGRLFASHPRLGALGAYRTDYDGRSRGYSAPAYRLRLMLTTEARSDPSRTVRVGTLLARAYARRGYRRGQFVLGGATLYSPAVIRALDRAGLLDDPRLGRTRMGEDHIFGLCMSALGFEMRDYGTAADDLPFGATWKGLPASPEELLERGKEIVHSTKSHEGQDESAVREVFRAAREAGREPIL